MVTDATEKRFEADIESFFLSPAGGYTKGADTYDAKQGLYVNTLIDFVQRTQPKEWARFENANQVDPVRKFCTAFNTACETEGLLSVLRHGFKHRGLRFRVCYFKPESALNQAAAAQWAANTIECYRQWYFSADTTTHPLATDAIAARAPQNRRLLLDLAATAARAAASSSGWAKSWGV